MKDGWLKHNITSILAILWSVAAITIFILVLTKDIKSDDKTVYLIIQGAFSIITFILGYYYGASKSRPEISDNKTNSNQQTT